MNDIRRAEVADTEDIAAIYNHYLGISTMDLEKKTSTYYSQWMDQSDQREELWVIAQKPLICWGIIKLYSDRVGYRRTVETSVYCHPDHRYKGWGPKMKHHLIARCKALGYHHIIARIQSDNEASINYNLKLGYEVVGRQKEIGYVDGKWKDVTILQYLIK
jgi:Sortase and related acyltransferases